MKIPVAIKVLRENTSPKANKEILDVSPCTLSGREHRREPPAAGLGSGLALFTGVWRDTLWSPKPRLLTSCLWAMFLVCDGWGWIE